MHLVVSLLAAEAAAVHLRGWSWQIRSSSWSSTAWWCTCRAVCLHWMQLQHAALLVPTALNRCGLS